MVRRVEDGESEGVVISVHNFEAHHRSKTLVHNELDHGSQQ